MAQSYTEHLNKGIAYAQKKFKDFSAHYFDPGGLSRLNWQNSNGSREYQIIFIMDMRDGVLTIHGDLGYAIYRFPENTTLEDIAQIGVFEYFESKFVFGSERFEFDEEYAECQLKEYLYYNQKSEKGKIILNRVIHRFIESCGDDGFANNGNSDINNEIEQLDCDYEEWAYSVGMLPHIRHILYWQAIRSWRGMWESIRFER